MICSESPSLKLIEIFREKGAEVDYNDPYVPKLPKTRKYKYNMSSVDLKDIKDYDLVILSTDHTDYDYKKLASDAKIIVDTRNAFGKRGIVKENIFKA